MLWLAGARIGAAVTSCGDGIKRHFEVPLGGEGRCGVLISHEQGDAETKEESKDDRDTGDGNGIVHDQRSNGVILVVSRVGNCAEGSLGVHIF